LAMATGSIRPNNAFEIGLAKKRLITQCEH
jgi:hypothetical protein